MEKRRIAIILKTTEDDENPNEHARENEEMHAGEEEELIQEEYTEERRMRGRM